MCSSDLSRFRRAFSQSHLLRDDHGGIRDPLRFTVQDAHRRQAQRLEARRQSFGLRMAFRADMALRVLLGFQCINVMYEYDFQDFLRPMVKFYFAQGAQCAPREL